MLDMGIGNQKLTLSADRFFAGFIAALRTVRNDEVGHSVRLTGDRVTLNRAFWHAINAPEAHFVERERLSIDFDPLYGVSPWFERALTRAQRDLLISFPNPSYVAVEIKLDTDQAERLLKITGHRDEFVALARAFMARMAEPK
jgi:hypothetical protein